jgi:DNA-binding response OmpR family regulator
MSSTILVVEDEPAIAELIAVNLSFAGHKVLRAADTDRRTHTPNTYHYADSPNG